MVTFVFFIIINNVTHVFMMIINVVIFVFLMIETTLKSLQKAIFANHRRLSPSQIIWPGDKEMGHGDEMLDSLSHTIFNTPRFNTTLDKILGFNIAGY